MRAKFGQSSDDSLKGLGLKLALCHLVLLLERLWQVAWPALTLLALLIALALLDVFSALPVWLHIALLLAFLLGLGLAVRRAVLHFQRPQFLEVRRRLEENSGQPHRPLTTLGDNLMAGQGNRQSEALWQTHLEQVRDRLARIPVGAPRPILAKADPYGLSAVVGLLLVIGLVVGGWNWQERFQRAFIAQITVPGSDAASLDAWINPPKYTRLPPVFLDPDKKEPLTVVAGSTLLAHAQSSAQPSLEIDGQSLPFENFSRDAYKIEQVIAGGKNISVEAGGTVLAAWPINLVADMPPMIAFADPPQRTERMSLRLSYEGSDDFGVTGLAARVNRIDKPDLAPVELELLLPGGDPTQVEGVSFHDLTAHPWAGLAVEIQLVAVDALGQESVSAPARSVLPERVFNHPIARELVALRKELTLDPDNRYPIVRSLRQIANRPLEYHNDFLVALALNSATGRLINNEQSSAVPEVQDLLWNTALHIEEGELALAESDLRAAQQALLDALSKGADQAEIEQLMDELQNAMDNFLNSLADQLQAKMNSGQQDQGPPDGPTLDSQDLKDMIDKARELAQNGARDAARDLLSQLQEMLENLQAQPFAQMMDQAQQQASEMMRDMEHMLDRQKQLMDRSHRRSRERNPSDSQRNAQQQDSQNDAMDQEQLRKELGEMMRQLSDMMGDLPQSLGRAETEMRSARDSLEKNNSAGAVPPQGRSLDYLQQGMQSMAESFMQMFDSAQGKGSGTVGSRPGQSPSGDPLGRDTGYGRKEAIEGVEIPDEMDLLRSREILQELRRRRGEFQRPPVELDYIDRLLHQF